MKRLEEIVDQLEGESASLEESAEEKIKTLLDEDR